MVNASLTPSLLPTAILASQPTYLPKVASFRSLATAIGTASFTSFNAPPMEEMDSRVEPNSDRPQQLRHFKIRNLRFKMANLHFRKRSRDTLSIRKGRSRSDRPHQVYTTL